MPDARARVCVGAHVRAYGSVRGYIVNVHTRAGACVCTRVRSGHKYRKRRACVSANVSVNKCLQWHCSSSTTLIDRSTKREPCFGARKLAPPKNRAEKI